MNIPQGYKQTELGVIPEDWTICKICDGLAVVKSGKRLPMGYYVTENRTSHPYIRVIDMYDGGVDTANIMYVPDDAFPAIEKYRIFKDDIFISVAGSLGIVGKIPEKLDGANLTENANRLTNISCNRDYLLYFLRSPYIQNVISSEQTIGAQPKLALTRIRNFEIILPDTQSEQRRIAGALSDVDALIATLDKKIAKKRLIKQGAMIQLLGGKGKKFCNQKIKDIVSIQKGDMLTSEQYIAGNIPVIAGGKSAAGYHNIANRPANTITISASGTSAGYVAFHDYPIFATDCSTIKPSETYDIRYIYYLLSFNQSELYVLQTGGAQPHVYPNDIYDLNIYYNSDIHTQQAIATILSDMDKEIADLEARRDKYKLIKSGMMQKLLTGQIRLVKPLAPIIPLEAPDAKVREIPLQTHIVAGHIVNALYQSSGWGRTKLQKTLHLVGYHCQLDFGNEYIRNTAGPDDQAMMNHIDGKFKQYRHVKIEAKKEHGKTRYNYIPTAMIDELEQVYETYPKTIRNAVDSLINKVEKMDLARAEIVSTLYAVWNNRIIKGEQISDDLLLEDFYAWSKHKSDFNRGLVLRGLNYMRKEEIIPMGWGKYIDKK
ncbi:MAG: restriction endonuclease subunit S [Alistipes senegalensis]|nr:restriction endonuclease subunit S [Bacteroides cellulosilyticus]MCM1351720.1 restriction endonuclease subunit S [Alistipes senegalensis]